MASFCTACGARNDDGAVYCEGCGAPLRAAVPTAAISAGTSDPTVSRARRRAPIVGGIALLALAILGAAGWWVWSAPAASSAAFAAALRDAGAAAGGPSVDLLCLTNLPYDRPQINVGEYDANIRRWMEGLATAGLYAPGQAIAGGGARRMVQYTPMPELEEWRRGARLCVAKSWAVGEVRGAPFRAERFGQREVFRATVQWKAEGRAPWLDKVPDPLGRLRGVRQSGNDMIAESQHAFEMRDRRWVALSAADLRELPRAELASNAATGGATGGVLDGLKKLFGGLDVASPSLFQSNAPSESKAREFYEKENSEPMAAGVLKIESFKKTNATKRTDEGVEIYALEYQAELFFPKGNMPDCVDDSHFNPQCFMAQTQGIRFLKVGARITDRGTIIFQNSENGWRAKQLQSKR
jgi:hypothetical protein